MFWKKNKPKKATETLDPTPVAIPVKFHRPPTLQEQIARYTRNHLNKIAAQEGKESFEEANDFDVGEDSPMSPHEIEFDSRGEAEFEQFAAKALTSLKGKKPKADKTGKADPEGSDSASNTPPNAEAQSTLP